MRTLRCGLAALLACAMACPAAAGTAASSARADTVETRYPCLASGALAFARLADLPDGVVLRCGKLELTTADLQKALRHMVGFAPEELKRNAFFVLENEATPRLLALAAKAAGRDTAGKSERELVDGYLDRVTAKLSVSDGEIAAFYQQNRQLVGGASLDELREAIRQHLLDQKKAQAVREHIRTLGQRLEIEVSSHWTGRQAPLALDNPADEARRSGKPSIVAFTGPC